MADTDTPLPLDTREQIRAAARAISTNDDGLSFNQRHHVLMAMRDYLWSMALPEPRRQLEVRAASDTSVQSHLEAPASIRNPSPWDDPGQDRASAVKALEHHIYERQLERTIPVSADKTRIVAGIWTAIVSRLSAYEDPENGMSYDPHHPAVVNPPAEVVDSVGGVDPRPHPGRVALPENRTLEIQYVSHGIATPVEGDSLAHRFVNDQADKPASKDEPITTVVGCPAKGSPIAIRNDPLEPDVFYVGCPGKEGVRIDTSLMRMDHPKAPNEEAERGDRLLNAILRLHPHKQPITERALNLEMEALHGEAEDLLDGAVAKRADPERTITTAQGETLTPHQRLVNLRRRLEARSRDMPAGAERHWPEARTMKAWIGLSIHAGVDPANVAFNPATSSTTHPAIEAPDVAVRTFHDEHSRQYMEVAPVMFQGTVMDNDIKTVEVGADGRSVSQILREDFGARSAGRVHLDGGFASAHPMKVYNLTREGSANPIGWMMSEPQQSEIRQSTYRDQVDAHQADASLLWQLRPAPRDQAQQYDFAEELMGAMAGERLDHSGLQDLAPVVMDLTDNVTPPKVDDPFADAIGYEFNNVDLAYAPEPTLCKRLAYREMAAGNPDNAASLESANLDHERARIDALKAEQGSRISLD